MSARRLLVLTYYYPPQPGSGSNRWAAMVKYLRRLGDEVTVITAAPPGPRVDVEDDVVRTGSLNASPLIRRLLLRPDRTAASTAAIAAGGVMPEFLWKGIVPDPWLATWNPYAWRRVRRELATGGVDCLITSSPAESTHLLALSLGFHRPAWIADFRDGWSFEPLRPSFPTAMQRSLDRSLERRVAQAADVVIGATTPITEDFQVRLGVDARHVPNGFDPEAEVDMSIAEEYAGRVTFVHTGPLLGPRGRDPRPLLRGLRALIDEKPELRDRLQFLIAGRSEFDERGLLDEAGLDGIVRHLGYLPRAQALGLQRRACALVLLTSTARCEATGKLSEYMAAGRPIVALAHGNEAARIVTDTATGVVVRPDDVAGITAALRAAIDGELGAQSIRTGGRRTHIRRRLSRWPPLSKQRSKLTHVDQRPRARDRQRAG